MPADFCAWVNAENKAVLWEGCVGRITGTKPGLKES